MDNQFVQNEIHQTKHVDKARDRYVEEFIKK